MKSRKTPTVLLFPVFIRADLLGGKPHLWFQTVSLTIRLLTYHISARWFEELEILSTSASVQVHHSSHSKHLYR